MHTLMIGFTLQQRSIVESPQAETERAAALLQTCMERAFTLRVPLVAETHVGKTWYDAKG